MSEKLEQLKIAVFEKNEHNKVNTLFKLARKDQNIDLINKIADTFDFKKAHDYLVNKNLRYNAYNIADYLTNIHKNKKQVDKQLIRNLLDKESNINELSSEGFSSLFIACELNDIATVQLLIEQGINVNIKNDDASTGLMIASLNSNIEIVKLLIEHNASIDLQNEEQKTALMYASEKKHLEVVNTLLENGANSIIFTYDIDGDEEESALTLACKFNDFQTNDNVKVIAKILKYRKKINDLEAISLNSILYIEDIAKNLIHITIDIDDFNLSILEYTIIISSLQPEITNAMKIDFKSQEKSNGFIEDNLLANCSTLIKYDIDKKYPYELVLSELKLNGFNKVHELILNFLDKRKSINSGTVIFNNNKYFINIYNNQIKFTAPLEDKNIDLKKNTNSRNCYESKDGDIFIISKNKVTYKTSDNEDFEYSPIKIIGNILDNVNSHNPKALIEILKLFAKENPIKFSAHSFEWSKYKSYDNFMDELKKAFDPIEDELKELSENLQIKIAKFLFDNNLDEKNTWGMSKLNFGWSSPELKEWSNKEEKNEKAINFPLPAKYQKAINGTTISRFNDVCDLFKNEIEIRDDDKLALLFQNIEKKVFGEEFGNELYIREENLDGITFYTDVEYISIGIKLIFEQFREGNRKKHEEILVKAISNKSSNYVDIEIIQKGSRVNRLSSDKKLNKDTGTFEDIYDCFKNLCDWSIEANFIDGNFCIKYLSIDSDDIDTKPLKEEPIGFTHRLRFYK